MGSFEEQTFVYHSRSPHPTCFDWQRDSCDPKGPKNLRQVLLWLPSSGQSLSSACGHFHLVLQYMDFMLAVLSIGSCNQGHEDHLVVLEVRQDLR